MHSASPSAETEGAHAPDLHDRHPVEDVPTEWSVVITASREKPEILLAAIKSVRSAAVGRRVTVDVLVNGNEPLGADIDPLIRDCRTNQRVPALLRLWQLPVADKADALNHYIRMIWPGGALAFFMDGNVRALPGSLALLEEALARSPSALASTAVPTQGTSAARVAREMLSEGGLHGSLFAVRKEAMEEMRRRRLVLPRGLYRVDGLLGAFFAFGLDPTRYDWQSSRIQVETRASWRIEPPELWRASYWRILVRRRQRQAQGRLESAAFSDHLHRQRRPIESLPPTVRELVGNWLVSLTDEERRDVLRPGASLRAWERLQKHDVREQSPVARPDLEVNL